MTSVDFMLSAKDSDGFKFMGVPPKHAGKTGAANQPTSQISQTLTSGRWID